MKSDFDEGFSVALAYADEYQARIDDAIELIAQYGQIDGDHHKAWVLDQVARVLCADHYDDWVSDMRGELNEDGDYEYDYNEGIAP